MARQLRSKSKRKSKLGTGKRFGSLVQSLKARKGKSKIKNPEALAAWIGRKKYGAKKMARLSASARIPGRIKRSKRGSKRGSIVVL